LDGRYSLFVWRKKLLCHVLLANFGNQIFVMMFLGRSGSVESNIMTGSEWILYSLLGDDRAGRASHINSCLVFAIVAARKALLVISLKGKVNFFDHYPTWDMTNAI